MLNFGHTLGHALEKASGYGTLTHGEAVALGMMAASKWGEAWGVTEQGTSAAMEVMLKKWGLPYELPAHSNSLLAEEMGYDKKASGSRITLVLLRQLGQAILYPVERAWLKEKLRGMIP